MYINDLNIAISLQTRVVETANFNLALVLGSRSGNHTLKGHYGIYSDLASLKEAGFLESDPEYKILTKLFSQNPKPAEVMVYVGDSTKLISERANNATSQNNNWYIMLITERDKATLNAAGDYALANEKLFIGGASSKTVLTSRNNIREAYLIHNQASEFPEVAWVGDVITKPVGSYTWKFRTPAGVTASNFSLTELKEIRQLKAQTLSLRAGVVYSDNGITTGGEHIDIIQSRDYIKSRLEEELFLLLTRNDKVSFDDLGIAKVESVIRSVLNEAGDIGIIATASSDEDRKASDEGKYIYTVSIPTRAEVSANKRAERALPNVRFSLTIAGAIHSVDISGVISA